MTHTHECTVCYQPFTAHEDREQWPPRCCHGCRCGEGREECDVMPGDCEACRENPNDKREIVRRRKDGS